MSALALTLASRLIISEAVIVDTESTPKQALTTSWNLTKAYAFARFLYVSIYFICINAPTFAKATQFGSVFMQTYSYSFIVLGYIIYALFDAIEPALQTAFYLKSNSEYKN